MIDGAMVEIDPQGAGRLEMVTTVAELTEGSPFELERFDDLGDGNLLLTFCLRKPGIAIGYRNVIDLQHRLATRFDVVAAERRSGMAS